MKKNGMLEVLAICMVCGLISGLIINVHMLYRRVDRLEQTDEVEKLHSDMVGVTERLDKLEADLATPAEPQEVEIEICECYKKEEATPGDASEPQEDTEEAEPAPEPTEVPEAKEEASGELEYAGIFELTAYPETGNPCANGSYPTTGYTVASNYFPLGTRIYIEGMGEYVVEDTGGMASNVIDIYMGDYDTCIEFGRRQAGIYIVSSYNE